MRVFIMKLYIPFLSLVLTCTLGLFATADHLAYLKTQPMIEASIVNFNVENVRSQVASIDLPADIKADILKNIKITAKTVRTQLRLQLLEKSQKSRVWAGIGSIILIRVAITALSSINYANLVGFFIISLCHNKIEDYVVQDPKSAPFKAVGKSAGNIVASTVGMKDLLRLAFSCTAVGFAIQNTKFAYYGTSVIKQKLEKIDQILDIIESAQQNQSQN